jgi:metal-responsive CopG/Arc/MetJ family transcriptional regulator
MPSASARKPISTSQVSARRGKSAKAAKERVLIEFPAAALRRADKAARAAGVSRSEFIRTAVEQRIEGIATAEFERELAEAYKANAESNLRILKEFEHVDREAWEALP